MEELYLELFQAKESLERECWLDALYSSLEAYVRHKRGTFLRKECGRLNVYEKSSGMGSFDLQTRQVLWKYAAMAWRDGWPTALSSAENAESDDEVEAPKLTALPKAAVKDQGGGLYKFRSHKVQAASLEEAWRLLDDAYQEEQEQHAKVGLFQIPKTIKKQ